MKIPVLLAAFALITFVTQAAEPVAKFTFAGDGLPKKWRAAKGTWKVTDGKLSGAELASDEHSAVLMYLAPHTDSKVQFSFQLNGSKGFNLSFNHPKGHLYRVAISQAALRITLDKDKKDPASKPIALGKVKAKFDQGKMYTLTCETVGDAVKASVGEDVKVEGKHEKIKLPKTGYRLVLKGEGVLFDDFTVVSQE